MERERQTVCLDTSNLALLYIKLSENFSTFRRRLIDKIELENSDVKTRFFEQDGKVYVEFTYRKEREKK